MILWLMLECKQPVTTPDTRKVNIVDFVAHILFIRKKFLRLDITRLLMQQLNQHVLDTVIPKVRIVQDVEILW